MEDAASRSPRLIGAPGRGPKPRSGAATRSNPETRAAPPNELGGALLEERRDAFAASRRTRNRRDGIALQFQLHLEADAAARQQQTLLTPNTKLAPTASCVAASNTERDAT